MTISASESHKMRLWIQNRGVWGCCVAIATSEAAARAMMAEKTPNYSEDDPLEAHDLDAGFKFVNTGNQ